MNKNNISPFFAVLFLVMALLLLLLPNGFGIPWYKNLYQGIPRWLAILNIIIFSSLGIIMFTPIKNKLSTKQLYLYCIILLLSFFLLDISLRKAPASLGPLMFFALMSIYVIYKRRERRLKKKNGEKDREDRRQET